MRNEMNLDCNPFEPTATGVPVHGDLLELHTADQVRAFLDDSHGAAGPKVLIIKGDYGSGKTCVMRWLHEHEFPRRRVKSFYFRDPGVHFYRLADTLLRTVGRKDFAKFLWELAHTYVNLPYSGNLFRDGFEDFVLRDNTRAEREQITNDFQNAILQIRDPDITNDEEIAHCLARIVTTTVTKPYFEYRDFVPKSRTSVVPESEEPAFFESLLKTILHGNNAREIAFVIDEFEEISLQKRLTRRAAHEYLTTLKRLIDLSEEHSLHFWLILSMTPPAYDKTIELQPALQERLARKPVDIGQLDGDAARQLVLARLSAVRSSVSDSTLFPFPDDLTTAPLLQPATYSSPRRLIKVCFTAIARATDETSLPFDKQYLAKVEESLYGESESSSI